MAPKAVDASRRFDRNRRFRGHGPLLQVAHPRAVPWRAFVGAGHARESGGCTDTASTRTVAFAAMGRPCNTFASITLDDAVARGRARPKVAKRGPCDYGFNQCLNHSTAAPAVVFRAGS
jgi:hypothetical protein